MEHRAETGKKDRMSGAWRELASQLQHDIFFGHLQPRQHLIEDEIMSGTGASRHAVRRSFEELERTGLVVRLPNKGVRVRSYTPEEVQNLYELRETLETKAASRIALPASTELVRKLEAIQQRHDSAIRSQDISLLFDANNEFHETLYGACGNVLLADAIRFYSWQTHPIRTRFIANKDWHLKAAEQHREMIRLLRTSDNRSLARVCYDHLQPSKEFYLSVHVAKAGRGGQARTASKGAGRR